MRIALLNVAERAQPRELGSALAQRGHHAKLLTGEVDGVTRVLENLLTRRLIQEHLTRLPASSAGLQLGRYDVAHAFDWSGGLAAVHWSGRSARPSVLSIMEPPHPSVLANKRMRLRIVQYVLDGAAAVVVPTEDAAEAARRWLGIEPAVIEPADAEAHERLYTRLVQAP